MFKPPADQHAPSTESGYLLLEVLIGAAISSTLIFLLLASLNGLSRSQERTLRVVEDVSTSAFERNLSRKFFASVRPAYRSDGTAFEGAGAAFSGQTYLEGFGGLSGRPFQAVLVQTQSTTQLAVSTPDQILTVAEWPYRTCRLEYQQYQGGYADTWREGETMAAIEPSSSLTLYTRYARPVPRRVRVVCRDRRRDLVVGAWELSADAWPQPRESETDLALPF